MSEALYQSQTTDQTAVNNTGDSSWIVNRRVDLAFIFGGAAASLSVPLLISWHSSILPIVFWGWILLFDGTHSWATYSRTYLDRHWRQTDRRLFGYSLLLFIVPVLVVMLQRVTASPLPVNAFLFLLQWWSYYHIVRQHYGFVSIYDRRSSLDRRAHLINKWALYIGLWLPYLAFLATHPVNIKLAQLSDLNIPMLAPGSSLFKLLYGLALSASVAIFIGFIVWQRRYAAREGRRHPGSIFVIVCMLLYGAIFYLIAPLEPLLPGARTPVQTFMLVQIMVTLFHNIQYHAIVWHYNKQRYQSIDERHQARDFGLARYVNRSFVSYFFVALIFSVVYGATAWFTTDYPSYRGDIPQTIFVPAAFSLWWGLSMHHYLLDQRIWRVSRNRELREDLRI